LPGLEGDEQKLYSFLEGKKGLVVVFWSETCSHCVRYDSYLNTFVERHPEIGLVAVAARQGESVQDIRSTVSERKLRFPILHDDAGNAAREWFVQQTPRAFLIDAGRKLLYRGAIDNFKYPEDPEYVAYLEPAIAAFLAGKPIERTETASFGCAVQSVYYILPKAIS
jgi:thiol-disulfide isomerase/thioredoxin